MADLDKPGCYGFVVCYEPGSEFCSGCSHEQSCSAIVLERRGALEKLLAGRVAGAFKGSPIRAEKPVKAMPVSTPAPAPTTAPETPMESKITEVKKGGSEPKRYATGEMSKKARQLDESLKRLKIDAPSLLKAGKNPMENVDRLAYFKLACELLLADGYLDREKLRQAYTDKLGWDTKTASSHLSIVASYMVASNILGVDGKTLIRVAR